MKTKKSNILLLIFILFLVGCAPPYYKYRNQSYKSPEAAIEAQNISVSTALSEIKPQSSPSDLKALFSVPSLASIEKSLSISKGASREVIDFVVKVTQLHYESFYQALVKSNEFSAIDLVRDEKPKDRLTSLSKAYDVAIVHHLDLKNESNWHFSIPGRNYKRYITVDNSLESTEQLQRWVSKIHSEVNMSNIVFRAITSKDADNLKTSDSKISAKSVGVGGKPLKNDSHVYDGKFELKDLRLSEASPRIFDDNNKKLLENLTYAETLELKDPRGFLILKNYSTVKSISTDYSCSKSIGKERLDGFKDKIKLEYAKLNTENARLKAYRGLSSAVTYTEMEYDIKKRTLKLDNEREVLRIIADSGLFATCKDTFANEPISQTILRFDNINGQLSSIEIRSSISSYDVARTAFINKYGTPTNARSVGSSRKMKPEESDSGFSYWENTQGDRLELKKDGSGSIGYTTISLQSKLYRIRSAENLEKVNIIKNNDI